MKHRKLRIAWSVAWGIVAVLLIALWVRSCWQSDYFERINGNHLASAQIMPGCVQVLYCGPFPNSIYRSEWKVFPVTAKADLHSFHWELSQGNCVIRFPIWLTVIICSAIAALPWLPWWSNRFSLRTLLIATTLVAVGMGLTGWLIEGAR